MYSDHNDKKQTIGSQGCGPTSMAMIVSTLTGNEVTPVELCEYSTENGYLTYDSGTKWTFFASVAKKYDINCKQTASYTVAKKALESGKMVIASMKPGRFTSGGHFVVLSGTETREGQTWYTVYDPNMDNNRYGSNSSEIEQGLEDDGIVKAVDSVIESEAKQYWIFDAPAPEQQAPSNSNARQKGLSEAAVEFLHGSEGFSGYVYKDVAGLDTIGYGHLIKPGETFNEPISKEEALELYNKDVGKFTTAVDNFEKEYNVKLTQNQYEAMVSFSYNLGENIWKENTTIKSLILSGNYTEQEIKDAFGLFCKYRDRETQEYVRSRGVYNRRIDEAELFLYGDYERRTDRALP